MSLVLITTGQLAGEGFDREIVWYGSLNLLSKDDVEDNIMRVMSKDIASELLEITFGKQSQLQEYSLPM